MAPAPLALRRLADDRAAAEVRELDGAAGARRVVWVEVGDRDAGLADGVTGVPLASRTSEVVEHAAAVARNEGLPFVVVLASTGVDVLEGIAALEGWGRLAKALSDCSGVVPT